MLCDNYESSKTIYSLYSEFRCCLIYTFLLSYRPFKSPLPTKSYPMLHYFVDSEIERTRFNHQKKKKKVLSKNDSATVKTQRCLSTLNISWNNVDQNGGYQNRDRINYDRRLISYCKTYISRSKQVNTTTFFY